MIRHYFKIILLACIASFPFMVRSQGSLLDMTFGINGKTVVGLNANYQYPYDLKVLPDGKMLVAGSKKLVSEHPLATSFLMKFTSDGKIDSTFGVNGLAQSYKESDHYVFNHKVAVLPNGKILSAFTMRNTTGFDVNKVVIVRYKSNGTIDSTFGVSGKIASHVGVSIKCTAFLIQDDGKMVVCGSWAIPNNGGYRWMVLRFTSSGLKDNTFGTNGKVEIDFGPDYEYLYSATQQSDGKIVVAGKSMLAQLSNSWGAGVARLNNNGQLDTTFGTGGKAIIPVFGGKMEKANSIVCLPDDKLIISGSNHWVDDEDKFCLVRLNADGIIDTTFGSNGLVYNVMPNKLNVNGLYALPEGGIIATSRTSWNGIMRFSPDGAFDTTFGINGIIGAAQLNLADSISGSVGLFVQPDGKIVSMYHYYENEQSFGEKYFAVLRLNADAASSVDDAIPESISAALYPNPVNDAAILEYDLWENTETEIVLYNQMGSLVRKLLPATHRSQGYHREIFEFDTAILPGVYWLELRTPNGRKTLQLVKI